MLGRNGTFHDFFKLLNDCIEKKIIYIIVHTHDNFLLVRQHNDALKVTCIVSLFLLSAHPLPD